MDSLNPENGSVAIDPLRRQPRVWAFWETGLWGVLIFIAMFIGQMTVLAFFLVKRGDLSNLGGAVEAVAGSGLALALSVIAGLPTTLAAIWLAVRLGHRSFADYLGLRWASWREFAIGLGGLILLVVGWDMMSRLIGHEVDPDFMNHVLKSARADGAFWLIVPSFCVAAPISEELLARGFLFRSWSESIVGVPGAIALSSLAWTALHLQYSWYFFGEVFCIGLWFGYMRYRSGSTWLTIVLHGLNNLAALAQTIYLTSS